jgi:hypothetical protein
MTARRVVDLRLAVDFERIPCQRDGFGYGVYELPVSW